MTNREQLEASINYSEYEDIEIAELLCDVVDTIGGMSYGLKEPLTKWLGLECDPETNNWGELDKRERADYYEEDEEHGTRLSYGQYRDKIESEEIAI